MNQQPSTFTPYQFPYPQDFKESVAASGFAGTTHALATTPLKTGAKTGLTPWAVRQSLKSATVLASFPLYKNFFDSNALAGAASGLTQAACSGFDIQLANPKNLGIKTASKQAWVISCQAPAGGILKFASSATFFSLFFTFTPQLASLLHNNEESGLSSLGKNAAAGGAGGFLSQLFSHPVKQGFQNGLSRIFKSAVMKSPSSIILGATLTTSLGVVEELKTAGNKLLK